MKLQVRFQSVAKGHLGTVLRGEPAATILWAVLLGYYDSIR